MSSYRTYKDKVLRDPAVKAEYDALQPEYDTIRAMVETQNSEHTTPMAESIPASKVDSSRN